jgi:aminoglycoside 2'-N-acetyltransferase I
MPAQLRIVHTADLSPSELRSARALMDEVFDGMTDFDWEHALGGLHALVEDEDELIGHAAVVQRRLLHGGVALRTGYVEGVAVRASRRGEGHGATMMRALESVIRASYHVGALGATEDAEPFYAHLGWQQWRGKTSMLTPTGIVPTPDEDGSIYVLQAGAALDLDGELTCDWREGDAW